MSFNETEDEITAVLDHMPFVHTTFYHAGRLRYWSRPCARSAACCSLIELEAS